MQPLECFETWAPPDARWSPWAKPVLFVTGGSTAIVPPLPTPPSPTLPVADGRTAMVIDLPGSAGVNWAVTAAQQGYRPVPLYNVAVRSSGGVLDLRSLVHAVSGAAPVLARISLAKEAPPAFILDADRLGPRAPASNPKPGEYDNRWIVFPQDFPSARLLQAHGIESVTVLTPDSRAPRHDLMHVLRSWHAGGITVRFLPIDGSSLTLNLRSSLFQRINEWFTLRFSGLHRNSAGGFGGIVPTPSEGGSGFS